MTHKHIFNTLVTKLKLLDFVDNPELEARIFICDVLRIKPKDFFIGNYWSLVTDEAVSKMMKYCELRSEGKSVSSIIGVQDFYDCVYKVNDHVLIPRPDTEILVEYGIHLINKNDLKRAADFGTGPGTIAITVAKHCPGVNIDAIDISSEALSLLQENIPLNEIDADRVKPILCDMRVFTTADLYDVIFSNPPYIKSEVVREIRSVHAVDDPVITLDGGDDGLEFYHILFDIAVKYLKKGGYLVMEHGFDQRDQLKCIFSTAPLEYVECIKDYGGNDRVTIARRV